MKTFNKRYKFLVKEFIILLWFYLETKFMRFLKLFRFKSDSSVIPNGMYCYTIDNERNVNQPCKNGEYWIKPCKYFRGTQKTGGIACTYVGYFGFDPCLFDQCKICSVNYKID